MRAARLFPLTLFILLAPPSPVRSAEEEHPAPTTSPATPGAALGAGEKLVFQAKWKLFSRAGRITVYADDAPAGEPATGPTQAETPPRRRIRVDVSSDGMIARLYTYNAIGETYFDPLTGKMLSGKYQSTAGSRREDRSIDFDFENHLAHYRDSLVPKRDADIPLPPGDPLDLITCLVTARRWNLKPGDTRDIVVLADNRFYPLRLRALRRETIKASLGTFDALLIVPEPIGAPRGLFRKGGGLRIWIEDTPRALPLRVEVKVPVGTVTANLVEYHPPLGPDEKPLGDVLRAED
jgi:Protein of unknown function (DUF3108)